MFLFYVDLWSLFIFIIYDLAMTFLILSSTRSVKYIFPDKLFEFDLGI